MKLSMRSEGFSKTRKYLDSLLDRSRLSILDHYGKEGVTALQRATPRDSGLTASSWSYKIEKTNTGVSLSFFNSNIQNGVPIAVILQYGHGTGTGGYVQGRDYINPALKPIFDRISEQLRKELSKV